MLLVNAGLGRDRYFSIVSNEQVKTVKTSQGHIDVMVQSRYTGDGQFNLTKTSVQLTETTDNPDEVDGLKPSRLKRSSTGIQRDLNVSNALNKAAAAEATDPNNSSSSRDNVINALYTLVVLSIMFLFEMGFDKVFYSDYLMQSLVHLITILSDVREFNKTRHGLIFANTLHHAYHRSFLWTLFWMRNLVRLVLVIIALSVTSHFHLSEISGSPDHGKLKFKCGN